jgi:ribosome-binding factor A
MSLRMAKVQKLAQEVLGEAIQGLKDPRIGFVTVTAVRITQDLRHARVLVSILGSEQGQQTTMEALRSATPHLRAELGRQVRMRFIPELQFELDRGPQEAARIEQLLRKVHQRPQEGGEPEPGTSPGGPDAGGPQESVAIDASPGASGSSSQGESRLPTAPGRVRRVRDT